MDECPAVEELAAFVESGEALPALAAHVEACEACEASLKALDKEVRSLQISISQLWFRERISCPDDTTLAQYRTKKLKKDAREYVEFHIEDLGCPFCQAAVAAAEEQGSEEGRRRITRSRERVGEATTVLLDDLRQRRKS